MLPCGAYLYFPKENVGQDGHNLTPDYEGNIVANILS